MVKNMRMPYTRLQKPEIPGVYPAGKEFTVYLLKIGKGRPSGVYADRKFKTEEAAQIYFNKQSKI